MPITDDELDLEEQQRRQQQSIGKPISPATAPIGKPIAPTTVQPSPMASPSIQGALPQTDSISGAGPIAPKANPRSSDPNERLTALNEQGPPQYHGLKKVLDTIGGATTIGRAIEQGGGIGTEGYRDRLAAANTSAGIQAGQVETAQKQKEQDVTTAGQEAANELVPAPGGGGIEVQRKQVAPLVSAQTGAESREQVANTNATINLRKQGLDENGQPIPPENLTPKEQQDIALNKSRQDLADAEANYNKFKSDPNSPMYRFAQERLKIAMDSYALRQKEFGFNYEPSTLTPGERNTLPTDVSGNPVALHSPLKPGATTVTAAYRAANMISQIPRMTQEITELSNSIGPIAGRWSQFWQGDVGVADPKFAHLKDDMEFAASAMALAHTQGRLSNIVAEKFDRMYQAGKQDPKNMIAAMQVAAEWLPKVMQNAQTVGEQSGQAPASGGGAGAGAQSQPPGASGPNGKPSVAEWLKQRGQNAH